MSSPIPTEKKVVQMDFGEAIKRLLAGAKVTKLEWNNKAEFFLLDGEYLCVHHSGDDDDIYHRLIIREADLKGTDWIVLE